MKTQIKVAVRVTGGVSVTKDNITFDFNKDHPSDITNLTKISIKKCKILRNIYLYGYEFTRGASAYAKTAFMEYLKSFYQLTEDDENIQINFERFIQEPLAKLGSNLRKLDCIVYPYSRSDINRMIAKTIRDNTNILSSNYLSFELLKRNVGDIELEEDKFEVAYKGELSGKEYKKILKEAKDCVAKLKGESYCPNLGGLKPPALAGSFSVSCLLCRRERISSW